MAIILLKMPYFYAEMNLELSFCSLVNFCISALSGMFTCVLYPYTCLLVKHHREAIGIVTCLAGNIIILVSGRMSECLQFKESILQEFVKWGEKTQI